jgi:pimeloyl-ACP methyl ester carboxylesterase
MSTLAHARTGAGEPLVLLHGIGATSELWDPVVPAAAARHEVIAVDLPGFGGSAALDPSTPPSAAALAAAVHDFLQAKGVERPHVAGNSLGGRVALELARRGGARTVTAFSPAGFAGPREQRFAEISFAITRAVARSIRPFAWPLARSAAGRTVLAGQFFSRPWRLPPDVMLRSTHAFLDCPGFDATMTENSRGPFARGEEIGVPVTIAWGTRDLILLPRQARRAARALPHARVVPLPGCGHVPFFDDPELCARVLLDGSSPT